MREPDKHAWFVIVSSVLFLAKELGYPRVKWFLRDQICIGGGR